MFTQPVIEAYDKTNAMWEIMIMLLVSFLLGWLFGYLWHKDGSTNQELSSGLTAKFTNPDITDLKIVEGIGPKIEELLKKSGIKDLKELANTDISTLKKILTEGGDRFAMHDPSSWADQATLAVEGRWDDLAKYQDLLIGGRAS